MVRSLPPQGVVVVVLPVVQKVLPLEVRLELGRRGQEKRAAVGERPVPLRGISNVQRVEGWQPLVPPRTLGARVEGLHSEERSPPLLEQHCTAALLPARICSQ